MPQPVDLALQLINSGLNLTTFLNLISQALLQRSKPAQALITEQNQDSRQERTAK